MSRKLKGNGLCGCGCGGRTSRYTQHHFPHGIKPGDFKLFLKGHSRRLSGVDYCEEDRGYKTQCWIWQLSLAESGYGQFQGQRAHVVYWEREHGKVPEGLQIDHLCRVRSCVNPDHLEAVPPAINVRRSRVARLTQEQVDEIRTRALSTSQAALAVEFDIHPSAISRIVNHKRWKDVIVSPKA